MKAHIVFNIINIIEVLVIFILSINYKEFKKASDPIGLRNGAFLGLLIVILTMLNTSFTFYLLKIKIINEYELSIVTKITFKMLLYIDPSILGKVSRPSMMLLKSMLVINWIGIICALFFVLKPLVYQPIATRFDREKVRILLKKYGDNPISYVAVESDKKYYFGKNVEGVIAYVIATGVAVCAGDPICSDENMPLFIAEFVVYCKQNELDICFIQTLEKYIPL